MPLYLQKSLNQAHFENGTYEQIIAHNGMKVELNGLEAPDELRVNTLRQHVTNKKVDRPKLTCNHCEKSLNNTETNVASWKSRKNKLRALKNLWRHKQWQQEHYLW